MLSNLQKGLRIIDIQKHVQDMSSPEILYTYDNIITAGQTAHLMAKLRKLEVIDIDKLSVFGTTIGIQPRVLKDTTIPIIENLGLIEVKKDSAGKIIKIEENIPDNSKILEITGEFFDDQTPKEVEIASLNILNLTNEIPRTKEEIYENLLSEGLKENNINSALAIGKASQFISEYKIPQTDNSMIYSPLVWEEKTVSKISEIVTHMEYPKKMEVYELLQKIKQKQGMPVENMNNQIKAFAKVGVLMPSAVTTRDGVVKQFVFTGDMLAQKKLKMPKDVFEQVKLLLACIRFGQNYSRISRIREPSLLLNALLERDTHTVGPASAIGTDYVLLEKEGIVRVEKNRRYPDRFDMTLMKPDIAKTCLEIIKIGEKSSLEGRREDMSELMIAGNYENSVQTRIKSTISMEQVQEVQRKIVEVLRGEKVD